MLRSFLLTVLLVLVLFSCKKEYSYEGSIIVVNREAEFTFNGTPGLCDNPIISGNYTASIALNSDNTIKLSVAVTRVGAYSIATPVINGIVFSGSGKFASTGNQNVVLKGAGIPEVAGVFEFAPAANTCSFPVTVLAKPMADSVEIYYEATVGALHFKQTVTETNGYEAGSSVAGYDDAIPGSYISPSVKPAPLHKTEMAIIKGVLHNYRSLSNAAFKDFFAPGLYPWAVFGKDGVSLSWTDENGNHWSTYNIPGDQTGSSFTIISAEDVNGLGIYHIRVKAKFNCKLYDVNGNVKTLTNGIYVGYFGKN
jgi:hypothetical protein